MTPAAAEQQARKAREEQRVLHRCVVRLTVEVHWFYGERYGITPAVVQDISEDGVYLLSQSEIPIDARVEFTVKVPPELSVEGNRRVRFEGHVLRVETHAQGGFGIGARLDHYQALAEEPALDPAPVTGNGQPDWRLPPRLKDRDRTLTLCAVLLLLLAAVWGFDQLRLRTGDPLKPQLTTGNPSARVWVHARTGLYYCRDSESYGRLTPGRVMRQQEAQQNYHRPASGTPCE